VGEDTSAGLLRVKPWLIAGAWLRKCAGQRGRDPVSGLPSRVAYQIRSQWFRAEQA